MFIISLGLQYLDLDEKFNNENRVQHLFKCPITKIKSFNKSNIENGINKVSYTCMVFPSQQVGCPTKVVQPTVLFSNSKHFFV